MYTEFIIYAFRDEWPFSILVSSMAFILSFTAVFIHPKYIKDWIDHTRNFSFATNYYLKKYMHQFLSHGENFLQNTSNISLALLVASVIAFSLHIVMSKARNLTSQLLLSYHFWMQESSSKTRLVWMQMCLIRLFTATVSRPRPSDASNSLKAQPQKGSPQEERGSTYKGVLMETVMTKYPELHTYKDMLPNLPLPSLYETLKRLRNSLSAFANQNTMEAATLPYAYETRLVEFEKGIGPYLQLLLLFRRWVLADNYVSEWWERYVYCMNRQPLPINSNYYILDMSHFTPTYVQSARAATLLHHFLKFNQLILNQKLTPVQVFGTVPVCMEQYRRIFSTVRVPCSKIDTIVHYEPHQSQHVVVYCHGLYYSFTVTTKNINSPSFFSNDYNRPINFLPLSPYELQCILEEILEDSKSRSAHVSNVSDINSLTALPRDEWAEIRKRHFASGINWQSLETIESSILMLVLETDPSVELGHYAKEGQYLIGGPACWHDKSINLVVFSNGRMGLHCEHSYADAPAIAHAHEYALSCEFVNESYDSFGNCKQFEDTHITNGNLIRHKNTLQKSNTQIQRLEWDLGIDEEIHRAYKFSKEKHDNLDLCINDFSSFGKGAMKSHKISPDAFVQIAIQLAYYKMHNEFALTYEASTTRLYLKGRTETVRSLTHDVMSFVRALEDGEMSKAQKVQLLKGAAKKHQELYKDAMTGRGCDRHLFALYVMSKMIGRDCDILRDILSMPWTLSTSQSPQHQIKTQVDFDSPLFQHKLSPGGGFGPVTANGYGVAYMFPSNNKLFFHVSSLKTVNDDEKHNSSKFCQQIFDSLTFLLALLAD